MPRGEKIRVFAFTFGIFFGSPFFPFGVGYIPSPTAPVPFKIGEVGRNGGKQWPSVAIRPLKRSLV